jgi:glucose/arabinose dehydrogenase
MKISKFLVIVATTTLLPGSSSAAADCAGAPPLAGAAVPSGFCATATHTGLSKPRGVLVTSDGDAFTIELGASAVTWLHPTRDEHVQFAQWPGLNHGLIEVGGFIFFSSDTQVVRVPKPVRAAMMMDVAPTPIAATAYLKVVDGIPAGGHSTRALAADATHFYVHVGSRGNVDADSSRSRILRFPLAPLVASTGPAAPLAWSSGELFADGLRNEAALGFDTAGLLWGAENGADNVFREDLGGRIHNDNPAEEVNAFVAPGKFYGYPYCFSEYLLPAANGGKGPGTQWAWPSFMNDGVHTDAWCASTANVVPPTYALPAHTAPLGLEFYPAGPPLVVRDAAATGKSNVTDWSFPASFAGDMFVALHGSWNRDVPQGYEVVRIPFAKPGDPQPAANHEDFFGSAAKPDNTWGHRPVDVAVGPRGDLLVSSDATGTVFSVRFVNRTVVAPSATPVPGSDSDTSAAAASLMHGTTFWRGGVAAAATAAAAAAAVLAVLF